MGFIIREMGKDASASDRMRYRTLIQALAAARKAADIDQVDASVAIGKFHNFVSKTETFARKLGIMEFIDLCTFYNVDPKILLTLVKKKRSDFKRSS